MHKHRTKLFFLLGGIFAVLISVAPSLRAQVDPDPPLLSDITIIAVGENDATVTWKTNEEADSLINYGLDRFYGITRDPIPDKKNHQLKLTDLERATTYHFRVVSSDPSGNQAVSGDFSFTTGGFEDIPEIEKVVDKTQQALVAQAIDAIEEITDPNAIRIVQQSVTSATERILRPPSIIGLPRVTEIGPDRATISWVTDRESDSVVSYATDEEYDALSDSPYAGDQGDLDFSGIEHKITLVGLKPSTLYHFRVSSEDEFNLVGRSKDSTFNTSSFLPTLKLVEVVKVQEESATLSWTTDIPAAGFVEYRNMETGEIKSKGTPEFAVNHTIQISELVFGTTYSAVIKAENRDGERVESDPITFTTTKDIAPPIISRVTNESTLYPGAETRIQTVVGWSTDEPSRCTLSYREGIDPNVDSYSENTEMEAVTSHVSVVLSFLPSTVYQFWIECGDYAGNFSRSEDFVLFTPEKEKSIIDIILENFEGTFGWVKNIGKK